jgi:hypothetical protein
MEKERKTVGKITEEECPRLKRPASGMPRGTSLSPHLLIKAGGRG